jgi:glycolate oxidase iron-sulfur subunit
MAARLQARKVDNVLATGASTVVTANPGCIIQIAQGLRARGALLDVVHLVDILDESYRNAPSPPLPSGERAG